MIDFVGSACSRRGDDDQRLSVGSSRTCRFGRLADGPRARRCRTSTMPIARLSLIMFRSGVAAALAWQSYVIAPNAALV